MAEDKTRRTGALPEALRPPPGPSLGEALGATRQRLDWSFKRMAMAVGVPYETYVSLEGDAILPTFGQLRAICDLLEQGPVYVNRMVAQTARCILQSSLDSVGRRPRAMAARRRGVAREDEEQALWSNMPAPVRRAVGDELGIDADDPAALATALRKLAATAADERARALESMVVSLELEGEAEALEQLENEE